MGRKKLVQRTEKKVNDESDGVYYDYIPTRTDSKFKNYNFAASVILKGTLLLGSEEAATDIFEAELGEWLPSDWNFEIDRFTISEKDPILQISAYIDIPDVGDDQDELDRIIASINGYIKSEHMGQLTVDYVVPNDGEPWWK